MRARRRAPCAEACRASGLLQALLGAAVLPVAVRGGGGRLTKGVEHARDVAAVEAARHQLLWQRLLCVGRLEVLAALRLGRVGVLVIRQVCLGVRA